MRIKSFSAERVHGFMDFDIKFYDSLTFLTGINGSGKTTVVNAISAMLSPSLITLVNLEFDQMELTISTDGTNEIAIGARKEEDRLVLSASTLGEELEITPITFEEDDERLSYRDRDRVASYYREFAAENSKHPVLSLYRDLPNPMYLGIERRISEFLDPEDKRRRKYGLRRPARFMARPLGIGLFEAVDLAERSYRLVQARQRGLTNDLRNNLIVNALKYEESGSPIEMKIPKLSEEEISEKVALTWHALQRMGVPPEEVAGYLEQFLARLADLSKVLGDVEDLEEILQSNDIEKQKALGEWFANYPQYERITALIEDVEDYVEQSHSANSAIDRYLDIINNFLADSHKRLEFDETGSLIVTFREEDRVPIESLSSGESQIVVIITQLSFNPVAQSANVFIVDEPELSLHVRWQELFVSSIREANPDLQLILATHSPSIILDEVDASVDLSKLVS